LEPERNAATEPQTEVAARAVAQEDGAREERAVLRSGAGVVEREIRDRNQRGLYSFKQHGRSGTNEVASFDDGGAIPVQSISPTETPLHINVDAENIGVTPSEVVAIVLSAPHPEHSVYWGNGGGLYERGISWAMNRLTGQLDPFPFNAGVIVARR